MRCSASRQSTTLPPGWSPKRSSPWRTMAYATPILWRRWFSKICSPIAPKLAASLGSGGEAIGRPRLAPGASPRKRTIRNSPTTPRRPNALRAIAIRIHQTRTLGSAGLVRAANLAEAGQKPRGSAVASSIIGRSPAGPLPLVAFDMLACYSGPQATKQELATGAHRRHCAGFAPVGSRCSRSVRYMRFGLDRKGPLK